MQVIARFRSSLLNAFFTVLLLLLSMPNHGGIAQTPTKTTESTVEQNQNTVTSFQSGTITGRVTADDGRPVRGAPVVLQARGKTVAKRYSAITDENGDFIFKNIDPGTYVAYAAYPGYVLSDSISAVKSPAPRYVSGDSISIRMTKGGVITGRVTDQDGQPLTDIFVSAIRLRDPDGQPINSNDANVERPTDDRGIYRLYGLKPGSYIVRTATRTGIRWNKTNPFLNDAPVYHPFGSRDTAREVLVSSNDEVSNINISYRSEPGHIIAGVINNFAPPRSVLASVYLAPAGNGTIDDFITAGLTNSPSKFAFYGVADGDYEIIAVYRNAEQPTVLSKVIPVTVKGKDITGLGLSPNPAGSISGSVVIEKLSTEIPPDKCAKPTSRFLEEIVVKAVGDGKISSKLEATFATDLQAGVDEKGAFLLGSLPVGSYSLEVLLPTEDAYVKSLSVSIQKQKPARGEAAKTVPELLRKLIAVREGEIAVGPLITVGWGAFGVSGVVQTAKPEIRLPNSLRVFLIPRENEATDDIWRYYEVAANEFGRFTIRNIMPGRYWIVARDAVRNADGPAQVGRLVWDASERSKLHKTAEEKGTEIELKPCSRATDITLIMPEQ